MGDDNGPAPPIKRAKRTMPWGAIPQSFEDSVRSIAIGDAGLGALVRLWLYASRQESNGRLPGYLVKRTVPADLLKLLLDHGFLQVDGTDYLIADFLGVNLSHGERETERLAARNRWQSPHFGKPSGEVPPKHTRCFGKPSGAQDRTGLEETELQLVLPPSAAPASPKGKSPQAIAFDHFAARFSDRYPGLKPSQRKSDFVNLAGLVKQHGLEEVKRRMDVLFDDPPFRLKAGSPSLGRFIPAFDELAGESHQNGLVTGKNSFMTVGLNGASHGV